MITGTLNMIMFNWLIFWLYWCWNNYS